MQLSEWLRTANVSIKSFSESVHVERAMVYRYLSGAVPRAKTISRIEKTTGGAVTAQDFYINAMNPNRIITQNSSRNLADVSNVLNYGRLLKADAVKTAA